MNIEAAGNNAANVALNAAVSNTQNAQSAQNAQSVGGEASVLDGAGVTVTTASPTAEEVATARRADDSGLAIQETVTSALALAEEVDGLAASLQAAAVASGEAATTASVRPASSQSVVAACNAVAAGDTEAAEEEISSWVLDGKSIEVNFSIYQLANLLQEVGQEQRNAARELRDCELNTEIASINSQATKQRRAATLSCMVSVTTAIIQTGLTIGGAAASGGGGGGDSEDGNLGVSQDANQAQTSAATTEAAMTSPEAAASNYKSIESQTTAGNKAAVEGRMSECNAAKATYEQKSGQLKGAISETEAFKSENQAKLTELNEQMNGGAAMDSETYGDLESQAATCKSNIEAADKTLGSLNSQLEGAKSEYCASMDSAMEKMTSDYNAASEQTKIADNKFAAEHEKAGFSGNRANLKDAQAKQAAQKDLGQQKSLMEAQVASEKANMGITPSQDDLNAADANVARCKGAQSRSPAYKMEVKSKRGGGGGGGAALQSMSQIIGSLGNGLAQMISSCGQAEATEESSNQKTAEAYRDETNDLFQQAQSLIDNARQLMQSVIQSESQSIEKIISA